ncbi:MAG: hypothetical protein QM755_13935 [Luteolibacter sp.]
MKLSLIFASGLGLGLLFGWLGSSQSSKPAAATARNERSPAVALGSKSDSPAPSSSDGPQETRTNRPAKPPKPDQPQVKTFSLSSGEESPEMKKFAEQFKKQEAEKKARKIDERLAALKSRLGLTDDQIAKVRSQLEKDPADNGVEAIFSGDGNSFALSSLLDGGKRAQALTDEKVAEGTHTRSAGKIRSLSAGTKGKPDRNRDQSRNDPSATGTHLDAGPKGSCLSGTRRVGSARRRATLCRWKRPAGHGSKYDQSPAGAPRCLEPHPHSGANESLRKHAFGE